MGRKILIVLIGCGGLLALGFLLIISVGLIAVFFIPGPEVGSPPPDAGSPDGSGSPPEGSAPEQPASSQVVDRILDQLERSNIAFNTPEQIQLGEPTTIRLLLSPSAPVEELTQQIRESGEPGEIEIEANSPEVQAISYEEPTEWVWDVKPTEPGKIEGETTLRPVESFDRTILVDVTWGQRLSGFVGANWEWLWTVILAPAALWVWNRWKKRNEEQRSGSPPPQSG